MNVKFQQGETVVGTLTLPAPPPLGTYVTLPNVGRLRVQQLTLNALGTPYYTAVIG